MSDSDQRRAALRPRFDPRGLTVAPSLLSADFASLGREIKRCLRAKCPWIHLDIMDGHFVPNLTIGPPVVQSLRKVSNRAFLDAHLMIEEPLRYAEAFAEAGADAITFHVETVKDPAAAIRTLRAFGVQAGISLKPQTPVSAIEPYLEMLDLVLVMTVEPGFGGQKLIPHTLNKVRRLALLRSEGKLPMHIQVDGGINGETARLAGTITESLRNIELVKSLGLTWPEIRRLQDHTRRIFDLEMDKVRKIRGLSFLQGTIVNLLRQSILFILLWLIFRKALSPGELISFQLILATIFGPLQQLGRVILTYRESEASLQAFDRLMATPIERRPDEPVEIGQIERLRFDDVVFRYRGAIEDAVAHLSFEAKLGDTIAFAGPSGSGKSTLVKLLLGLYAPTSGVVSVDGVPIDQLRYNRVRRQIGFVAQDPQLFSGTIRENLQLVKPAATDDEMLDVLRRASAGALLERSGHGLDTRLGEGGLRVSGGERQRLSIARALLREPRLFVFDEATSALDSLTEREIADAVREVSRSRQHMVILIAHRLSTIAHADRIYVLERGRIVETGTHEELVAAGRLYYAMWRQQIGERDPRIAPPAAAEAADMLS